MRRYITDRNWLTVFHLQPYAPDLNPVEGIWSVLRRTTVANRAFADPDHRRPPRPAPTPGPPRRSRRLPRRDRPRTPTIMTTSRIQGQ
ncbi:transposase [Streptomyces chartreusis]